MKRKTRRVLLATLILLGAVFWCGLLDGPTDSVPDYTVLNRLPDVDGNAADVLIPSFSRENQHREAVFRAVTASEGLTTAFFFSTEEALEAHQAFLPSPDQLEDLQAGFLGQVRDWSVHAGGGRLSGLNGCPASPARTHG